MTRRRFIADRWDRAAAKAELTGDQAIHLARVLRAEAGQSYDIVAGGFLHRATIASVHLSPGQERVLFALDEEFEADTALPLHLLLAIFKFDHFEWAIEKATELGVERITPVIARRTEKHLAQAATKRVERWRRIAHEASKQSRRTTVPNIADPQAVKGAIASVTGARILLSELEQALTYNEHLRTLAKAKPISLAIGPEGGWTPEELQLFATAAWTPVTLGPRILRAETAAIAAVAIAGSELSLRSKTSSNDSAPDLAENLPNFIEETT